MKLQDMLAQYIGLQHERAVWATLKQHLATYCSTDLGPAQDVIKAEDGVYSAVQESVVRRVVQELDDRIANLNQSIRAQGTLDVPVEEPKKVPAKKPAKKAVAK